MTRDSDTTQAPRMAAFYGRRKGKPLRAAQAAALDRVASRFGLPLGGPPPADPALLFGAPVDGVRLEIGFGGGEHLIHRAREQPGTGFIGVEPFLNGIAKAASAIEAHGLDNVRLTSVDAVALLDWLPAGSLDQIAILYPDPWPKKRHWKRRFVSADNVARFARVLKPSASLHFASDIDSYVDWALRHVRASGAFAWQARDPRDWRAPWTGWPGTRYEAKALREGRTPAYLTFRRR